MRPLAVGDGACASTSQGDGNGTRSSLSSMPSETDAVLEKGEVVLPPVHVGVEATANFLLDLRGPRADGGCHIPEDGSVLELLGRAEVGGD